MAIRVAVFLDNSNIFHRINTIKLSDPSWISFYDPLFLSKTLSRERSLVYIGFYCVYPPSYLLDGSEREKYKYNQTIKYYKAVEKLSSVEVKYGDLKGTAGSLQEKNVDTQVATDMVMMAALNKDDVAILISNDGDYLSAVKNTKVFNKRIELGFFRGSISMALMKECDLAIRMRKGYFRELQFQKK